MEIEEKHNRIMNMNAHFAWALAMWGSAEIAMEEENYISAIIGYYYSIFHAGFSLANTDHTFHFEDMKRIKHAKVQSWLKNKLSNKLNDDFRIIRWVRENVNYLGAQTPASKLRIIRGHPFGFNIDMWHGKISFFEMVNKTSHSSKNIILHILTILESYCKENKWPGPKKGDDWWVDEYLQEDVLLNVIPRGKSGIKILKKAFSLLD